MSEELKNTLKYLKNKNNTRRIKTITINEAYEVVEEIERLHSIIKEIREYIMTELITEWDIKNNGCVSGSDLPVDAITPILEIIDKESKE